MLADNFIKSHQTNFMSSALIPVEAVDNDQEFLAAILLDILKVQDTSLVQQLFRLKKP